MEKLEPYDLLVPFWLYSGGMTGGYGVKSVGLGFLPISHIFGHIRHYHADLFVISITGSGACLVIGAFHAGPSS